MQRQAYTIRSPGQCSHSGCSGKRTPGTPVRRTAFLPPRPLCSGKRTPATGGEIHPVRTSVQRQAYTIRSPGQCSSPGCSGKRTPGTPARRTAFRPHPRQAGRGKCIPSGFFLSKPPKLGRMGRLQCSAGTYPKSLGGRLAKRPARLTLLRFPPREFPPREICKGNPAKGFPAKGIPGKGIPNSRQGNPGQCPHSGCSG